MDRPRARHAQRAFVTSNVDRSGPSIPQINVYADVEMARDPIFC